MHVQTLKKGLENKRREMMVSRAGEEAPSPAPRIENKSKRICSTDSCEWVGDRWETISVERDGELFKTW